MAMARVFLLFLFWQSGAYAMGDFPVQASPPEISPPPGQWANDSVFVVITETTPNSVIHYTVDGSIPDEFSPIIASGDGFYIQSSTEVRAIAYHPELLTSSVSEARYTFSVAILKAVQLTPLWNGRCLFSLGTATLDAEIRFTNNGTEPDANSALHTGFFIYEENSVIRFRGSKPGYISTSAGLRDLVTMIYESTVVQTVAGTGMAGSTDGPASNARFSGPYGVDVAVDGTIFVADSGNSKIRKITPSGQVSTWAGSTDGFLDGNGVSARFSNPYDVVVDPSGVVYVTDYDNRRIRRISADQTVSTVCQTNSRPIKIILDSAGELRWSEFARLWHFDLINPPAPFAGTGINRVGGIPAAPGLVQHSPLEYYVVGRGLQNVTTGGVITNVISDIISSHIVGNMDRRVPDARIYNGVDVCRDSMGNHYFLTNNLVKKLRFDGMLVTLAGSSEYSSGYRDGDGKVASFDAPSGIAITGSGELIVADRLNHRIRKIAQSDRDFDGIPDSEEGGVNAFTVGVDDSTLDTDGDRQSDAFEWIAGTNPNDPTDKFQISGFSASQEANVQFRWQTSVRAKYLVFHSEDMVHWNALGSMVTGDGMPYQFCDEGGLGNKGFYRVEVFPNP